MNTNIQSNYTPTLNKRGFTYQLSSIGEAFLDFAESINRPVMDIGCAYGIASLLALEAGREVVAVDLSKDHLKHLVKEAPTEALNRLTVRNEKFPGQMDYPESFLGAVYISHVMPFLSPEEVHEAVAKLYRWLVPGGKVFIVSFTPFIKLCEPFLPVYEERKKNGEHWAGLVEDLKSFVTDQEFAKKLPDTLNHMDVSDYKRVFKEHKFKIEELDYFGDTESLLPEILRYDGRERLGLIARKPLTRSKKLMLPQN